MSPAADGVCKPRRDYTNMAHPVPCPVDTLRVQELDESSLSSQITNATKHFHVTLDSLVPLSTEFRILIWNFCKDMCCSSSATTHFSEWSYTVSLLFLFSSLEATEVLLLLMWSKGHDPTTTTWGVVFFVLFCFFKESFWHSTVNPRGQTRCSETGRLR